MRKAVGEVLWLLVLGAVTVIMGWLLFSGDILLYLAPRMVPMVWFGAFVLAVLTVHQGSVVLRALREHALDLARLQALVFLIPVVLFLTVAPTEAASSTLPNQNVQLIGTAASAAPSAAPEATPQPSASAASSATPAQATPEASSEVSVSSVSVETIDPAQAVPCALKSGTASFNADADFFAFYIFDSIEELAGREITLYGFVYKDASFPENTFLVSRLIITCCAADASVVGFHVRAEDISKFEDGEWFCVTGRVEAMLMDYDGAQYTFPILVDGELQRCETPPVEDGYVYP